MRSLRRLLAVCIGLTTLAAPTLAKEVERFGAWHYEAGADPMTDKGKFNAWLISDDDSPTSAMLIIGCAETGAGLQVAVKFAKYLGAEEGFRDFTWRFAKLNPVTEQWRYFSGYVVGVSMPPEGTEFRQYLRFRGPFKVRASTSDGGSVDASFTLSDSDVLTRLERDCKSE